jgi:hypothetical protein
MSALLLVGVHVRRYNNAAREFVSPQEALLSGVSKAAISFCTDANGDGIIELSEGCLAVGAACLEGALGWYSCWVKSSETKWRCSPMVLECATFCVFSCLCSP